MERYVEGRCYVCVYFFFFFSSRRRHTRLTCDWSSDVCSSDLKRGSTIAYIFLGWSLAAAVGLPLITFVASRYGWQVAYLGIGAGGIVSFALLAWQLPRKLYAAPIALRTWIDLGRNRLIVLLLAITVLQMSGQFTIFTFMGPLLKQLTGAGADAIGLVFALYGGFGFVGILIATRIVDP